MKYYILFISLCFVHSAYAHYPLHDAVQDGDRSDIEPLCTKQYLNQQDDTGNTPLHIAAKRGKNAQVLLQYTEIDLDAQNYEDQTALHLAVKNKHFTIAWLLLNNPLNTNAFSKINALDIYGQSALDYALEVESKQILRLLIDHDAKFSSDLPPRTVTYNRTILGTKNKNVKADETNKKKQTSWCHLL